MLKRTAFFIAVALASGLGSGAVFAKTRAYSGIACRVDPSKSSFADGVATFNVLNLVQPMGLTTMRGDRNLALVCPTPIDPTKGVGLLDFWVYDRHTSHEVMCLAELLDHEGNLIDSRHFETIGSRTAVFNRQVSFNGQMGHNLVLTCSVPRRSDQTGVSILASYSIAQP
jgi:hypothetical protein